MEIEKHLKREMNREMERVMEREIDMEREGRGIIERRGRRERGI